MKRKLSESITPKAGDVRTRVRYAWLPKIVANARIWLEQYEELEVYMIEDISANIEGKKVEFKVGKWVKVSERIIKWEIAGNIG